MREKTEDLPVFYDEKGRRWRITKVVTLILIISISALLYWILPLIFKKQNVPSYNITGSTSKIASKNSVYEFESVNDLTNHLNKTNTPIIGKGPLVRVVKISESPAGKISYDLFTGVTTKLLNKDDLLIIGDHEFVIERYGQTYGKRLALTFDDGPDPTYSSQILDVLSKESVPASFFVVGANVVKYPEVAKRMVREGHILGNHTFNHSDFELIGSFRATQEINQTDRVIRAATKHSSGYFRIPYAGNDEESLRDSIKEILEVQSMGYTITNYQFDSEDWRFTTGQKPKLPNLKGSEDIVMLVHDSGGDRSHTISYVNELIKHAKANGYQFAHLNSLYPQPNPLFSKVQPGIADQASFTIASAILVWPHTLIWWLFLISATVLLFTLTFNIVMANSYIKITKFKRRKHGYYPKVTALVPAYNEGRVLNKTVKSLLLSSYKKLDILIIDDGSKDDTWQIARDLAKNHSRIKAIRLRRNRGKAAALNRGIKVTKSEIIVCLDADTIFPKNTINKFVRHFSDHTVGAVAGVVKVGNQINSVSKWQALEYIVSIYIERNAQANLGSVMVVPGACGAWRRQAVLKAGGYSRVTLAEDSDLTLAIHKAGYRVVQDNQALSFTEVPMTFNTLAKQRFRWIFGNIQTFWKHRRMAFRHQNKWLARFFLPLAMSNILMFLLFWPLLLIITIENILAGRFAIILISLLAITIVQFIVSAISLILAKESFLHILYVPFTRIIYGPLRTYLIFRAIFTATRGAYVGWNKLVRTGSVKVQTLPNTQNPE